MPEGQLAFSDESPLAAEIRRIIGAGPYEEIIAVTPQFARPEGGTPPWTPKTAEDLDNLRNLSAKALAFLCLSQWEEGHWLYPGEWYDHIPEGYMVVDINDETEPFRRGKTDDDIRFGCLPYGFKRAEGDR